MPAIDIHDASLEDMNNVELLRSLAKPALDVKPDSIISRLPAALVGPYFSQVVRCGGRVLFAKHNGKPVGILVFVRDNNVSLEFLRRNQALVALHLALSPRWNDKILLAHTARTAFMMRGVSLPADFLDEISLLAVSSGHQGLGIGRLLVETLIASLASGGDRAACPILRVHADEDNTGAVRFYQANGFMKTGIQPVGAKRLVSFERALA